MWAIVIIGICFLALVVWRLIVMARQGRGPTRPIDSGHPHITDVDPHGSDRRRT